MHLSETSAMTEIFVWNKVDSMKTKYGKIRCMIISAKECQ